MAVLAGAAHFYRESIARNFANSVLAELGITATDLTIQSLGTDRLELSQLVLEQEDGARYQVSGLSLPLVFSGSAPKNISIEQLLVTPADSGSAPIPLAEMLQTILELPNSVPNTEVAVSRFLLPDLAPLENLLWQCTEQRQQLAFQLNAAHVTVDINRLDDRSHHVSVKIAFDGVADALSLTLNVRSGDSGVSIDGLLTINLAAWFSTLASNGLLPAGLTSLVGDIAAPIAIVLENDATRTVTASAELAFGGEIIAGYSPTESADINISVTLSESYRVSVEYPSLEWRINAQQIDILAGIDTFTAMPITLGDLKCHAGIVCSMTASLESGPLDLDGTTIGNAQITTSLTIASDDTIRIEISPDTVVTLSKIESAGFSANSISATQFTGARLTLDDNGVNFDTAFAINPAGTIVVLAGTEIAIPGIAGELSLQDNKLETSIVLSGNETMLSAQLDVSYDLTSGKASISTHDAILRFDTKNLSEQLPNWPYTWDLAAGSLATEFDLNLRHNDGDFEYQGTATLHIDKLSGNYGDIVFAGMHSSLSAIFDSVSGVTTLPSSIKMTLLEIGIPLEQITADFDLNVPEQSIQVRNLSMSALGGSMEAAPFLFSMKEDANSLILQPKSIQLQFMVDLAEFDHIQLTGSISGVLPVTVKGDTMTIENGRLKSDPPGGVIRYLPGIDTETEEVSDSPLNLVSRALANFQFDSLTADVDYTESGDLVLQMRLAGMNPDMDDKQPVILNLGVENNVPQLLRSLRAIRSIEDVLERKSN